MERIGYTANSRAATWCSLFIHPFINRMLHKASLLFDMQSLRHSPFAGLKHHAPYSSATPAGGLERMATPPIVGLQRVK